MRSLPGIAIAVVLAASWPAEAAATTTKILGVPHVKQTTNYSCVAASSIMQLKQIPGSTTNLVQVNNQNQIDRNTYYGYGNGKKRCWKDYVQDNLHRGLDPLAWAYILWRFSPAGFYFDDYSYSSAYSGTRAMVNHLYDHGTAPGALVNAGHHAMVFEGATTSCDPALEECRFMNPGYSITTVYVDDPWYDWNSNEPGRRLPDCTWNGQTYVCGKVGITAAIPWVTWSNYYYTPWTAQDCSYWNNKWVTVERSTVSGEPSAPVGLAQGETPILKPEWTAPSAESTPGEEWAEPQSTDILVAASADIADLDSAFTIAKAQFGLNERREFADAIEGGHITTVRRVRSLVTTFPDYILATVVGNRGLRSVAMFTLEAVGPTFAGMVVTPEPMIDFGSFSPVDAVNAARVAGHATRGNAELVWGWSAESRSPFEPIYAVNTDVGSTYITLAGDVRDQLHLEAPPVSVH